MVGVEQSETNPPSLTLKEFANAVFEKTHACTYLFHGFHTYV